MLEPCQCNLVYINCAKHQTRVETAVSKCIGYGAIRLIKSQINTEMAKKIGKKEAHERFLRRTKTTKCTKCMHRNVQSREYEQKSIAIEKCIKLTAMLTLFYTISSHINFHQCVRFCTRLFCIVHTAHCTQIINSTVSFSFEFQTPVAAISMQFKNPQKNIVNI